jgi:phosphoribosylformylglycinamidine synthase
VWADSVRKAPRGDGPPDDVATAVLDLLSHPSIASKRWVWEQYDHMIFLGTVQGPGGDAAVIRLPDTNVAVALSVDGPGRYCYLDPYEGARLAVAEAARNVACVGARPLAITNCLNFGNPEKPDVMWQFAEVIRGMGDACRELGTPVTGGNVSFYNETKGRAIFPTPVIGMLGVLDSPEKAVGMKLGKDGDALVLLGETDPEDFGGSAYAQVIHGIVGGPPPTLDLGRELKLHRLLFEACTGGVLVSAHDPSEGGLAIALCESAIPADVGFKLDPAPADDYRFLFSESPSRALVSCDAVDVDRLISMARDMAVPAHVIGSVGGSELAFGSFSVDKAEARDAYENSLASHIAGTS